MALNTDGVESSAVIDRVNVSIKEVIETKQTVNIERHIDKFASQ